MIGASGLLPVLMDFLEPLSGGCSDKLVPLLLE
jgi:hypothetical protein